MRCEGKVLCVPLCRQGRGARNVCDQCTRQALMQGLNVPGAQALPGGFVLMAWCLGGAACGVCKALWGGHLACGEPSGLLYSNWHVCC